MQPVRHWTPATVADALVRAYRLMPGRAVLSSGDSFSVDNHVVAAFGWAARFLSDGRDRRYLMTWARCKATGGSMRDLCREFGWVRATVENRRRKALKTITAGLNAERPQHLD